jgi:choline dehydrogenase
MVRRPGSGSVGSPQLLQLSGIGPEALLQEPGTNVVHHLPAVGRHLRDHVFVRLAYRRTKPITLNELTDSVPRRVLTMARYMLLKSGPLAANGVTAGAFSRSDPRLERPLVEITGEITGAIPGEVDVLENES